MTEKSKDTSSRHVSLLQGHYYTKTIHLTAGIICSTCTVIPKKLAIVKTPYGIAWYCLISLIMSLIAQTEYFLPKVEWATAQLGSTKQSP